MVGTAGALGTAPTGAPAAPRATPASRAPRTVRAPGPAPSLRVERRLLRESGARVVAGVDEVGRGALGGPVSVGVVLVDASTGTAPRGLRDSKLLAPEARERLAPRIRRWALGHAVGHASATEIDRVGILRALRLAGERALAALPLHPDLVLLDGNYDWLRRPAEAPALFPLVEVVPCAAEVPPVTTMIKADLRCAAVAAASVLAKTTRDAMMVEMSARHPSYGWAENKGYASPSHLRALREVGTCEEHRRSWNLRALAMGETGALPASAVPEECGPDDAARDDAAMSDGDHE